MGAGKNGIPIFLKKAMFMAEEQTILIVDDTPKNLQVLGRILKNEGFGIAAATSGERAIHIAKKIVPDLILLDVTMPEMDGLHVCRTLKQTPETSGIPVIFLTARTELDDMVAGFSAGAVDYIGKPFQSVELLVRVQTHLMARKAQAYQLENEKIRAAMEVSGAICHELHQPMQSLLGFSELILLQLSEEDPHYDKLKMIREQVDRMAAITKKLMHISRYETKEYGAGFRIMDIEKSTTGN